MSSPQHLEMDWWESSESNGLLSSKLKPGLRGLYLVNVKKKPRKRRGERKEQGEKTLWFLIDNLFLS